MGWSPDSVQTGAPVAQEIIPVRHAFPAGAHAVPAVQLAHEPLLQTLFSPQAVPFAWGCCVSVQEATPSEQVVCPR